MAAASRKQVNVLNTAVRKLSERFEVDDPDVFIKAAASLASDGVCARCLLRAVGHMGMEDYTLSAPSESQIITMLSSSNGSSGCSSPSPVPAEDARASTIMAAPGTVRPAPTCPVCFGLLFALLEDQGPSQLDHEMPTSGGPPPGQRSMATVTEVIESAEVSGVDLAWLRVQLKAFPGAVGCHSGPTTCHEQLQGRPSVAGLAAAVRRQTEVGPPDTVELAAAVATAAAAAVTSRVTMAEATALPAAELPLGPRLAMKSFSLDVGVLPAATAIRDVAMHAWLVAFVESRGVRCPAWRPTDIVPIPMVLRRALPIVLSRQLGLPAAAPQSASVNVSVVLLDNEKGLEDLRVLAEYQAAGRRQFHKHYRNKRHRAQQGAHGDGGAAAEPEAEPPQAPGGHGRLMSLEQASTAACSLPRAVLTRLFPWPPPPLAKRKGLHKQQTEKAPEPAGAAAGAALAEAAVAAASSEADGMAIEPEPSSSAAEAATAIPHVYVRAVHKPLLLAGRYCKMRRHMPQSPWFILETGARIGGGSVQEAIEYSVLPLYGTLTAKMITGGREDADVRMLGPGRPFILEIQGALRGHPPPETLRRLEQHMRDSKCGVTVQGLTACSPASLEAIKAAEEHKEKTYRALCWAEVPPEKEDLEALVAMGRVEVAQDTPVRVLHRRAAKIRPKWLRVESASAVPDKPHYFVIQLRTQAGAYVKEFCHGDFGRCRPSLGDLLGLIQKQRTAAAADAVAAIAPDGNGTADAAAAIAPDGNGTADTAADASPSTVADGAAPPSPVLVANTEESSAEVGSMAEAAAEDATTATGTATAAKRKFNPKPKPRPALPQKPDLQTKPDDKSYSKTGVHGSRKSTSPPNFPGSSRAPPAPESCDSSTFVRVDILQLDVLDVHLDHWP
ncbi:hypothetical protein VaNZ11_000771 [Volvox africanus]|uniref:tRNA pseudouridine(55) synthase n=1 Tax=Volvox africanus TaxID=51714 RepID=A0ABQ5RNR0_9CHLO|nr:hypothetical protein VaNZ11_000771 [Volvox africanus]